MHHEDKANGQNQKKIDALFGKYLVDRGVVNESVIVRAMDLQRDDIIPIGKLAIQERMLHSRQVMMILNAQIDSGKLFGQIAVDLGFMDQEAVKKLLSLQQQHRPPLLDVLRQMEVVDVRVLEKAYKKFLARDAERYSSS